MSVFPVLSTFAFAITDRSTTKLLIELFDGQKIESVIMRYGSVELDSFPQVLS